MKRELKKKEETKKEDPMKDLENEHVENFLEDLHSHIRVVGGVGWTGSHVEMGLEELARHLFPNGIEFRIHNRRIVPDPLREE